MGKGREEEGQGRPVRLAQKVKVGGCISFTEVFAVSEGGKVIVKCYLFRGIFLLVSRGWSLLCY